MKVALEYVDELRHLTPNAPLPKMRNCFVKELQQFVFVAPAESSAQTIVSVFFALFTVSMLNLDYNNQPASSSESRLPPTTSPDVVF